MDKPVVTEEEVNKLRRRVEAMEKVEAIIAKEIEENLDGWAHDLAIKIVKDLGLWE